ncbi:zinc-binding dehydrogenase [Mycolicibacterium brumae]|uniref:Alcohol dehydrogenase n=1 Tax=Mycolicibacterium brumae TaxID=85968 RepID=A0A2G5P6D2_9MYCO|nr:zinc-binding dehydrogenase [Mycolicibacterium brumae]MCV7194309.1 zinc-binding dehydrogenase [Mycolicibacterium brumae]PIB73931.1 alcohol dehydrogenase [Mycolicibacterium brumae]RWA20259.1 hypothetical protein MBRU_15435 [Mycolicibacterium brumae DSM 44177]UWW09662.1 zinc-binding dehydrogenase [Mycolicibacterium brumae]
MKAVSCLQGELSVVELPDPRPERGQLLLEVRRCGICGSDLHARSHTDDLYETLKGGGYEGAMRADTPTVLGHEFVGEVLETGPKVGGFRPGALVVAMPIRKLNDAGQMIGFCPDAPGGYAERTLAQAAFSFAVPNGLDVDIAAMTEPMAVALHAVNRAGIGGGDTAVVIGCGPVGLGIIAQLKVKGVKKIIASDFSPARRALAAQLGAHVVVDPSEGSVYDLLTDGFITNPQQMWDFGIDTLDNLRRIPAWERLYWVADKFGAADPKRPIIFECVGVPGMIEGICASAPLATRVVVAGVCMETDHFRPAMAIGKEIDLRFTFGYTPLEFRDTLHMLADGKLDVAPLITGRVGLGGVANAFDALGDPETHAKILIDPASDAVEP